MPAKEAGVEAMRFGVFELDPRNSELRKNGVLLKLAPQPFLVLQLLAANAGELVTREQLQQQVWGEGTFVDFDRNLNVCMAQIRTALNDAADSPRFIQTVPRRGYRFIASVEKVGAPAVPGAVLPAAPPAVRPARYPVRPLLALAGVAICAVVITVKWPRPAGQPMRTMLAALPFENLGGGAALDPFIDGLTEEMIGQLGGLAPDRLGVIARTSISRYRGIQKAIDQIGRELGVRYVVEGTVRSAGAGQDARVRISARLIKVADQGQVWTQTFERDNADLFEAEQQAAAQVAAAIVSQLFPAVQAHPVSTRTHSRAAWEAYHNGRYLAHKEDRASLERSVALFQQAAGIDSSFTEAYAAMAEAHVMLARSGASSVEHFALAKPAAERAITLDESSYEAHNALANSLFWNDWKWAEAERHFRRAVSINPSYALAQHDYAWLLIATGRPEDGLISLRRAIALDPVSPRINIDAGWLLLQARRFEEAAVQARRALALEPGMAEAQACLSRSLEYQGRYKAALEELLRIVPESPLRAQMASLAPEAALRRFHQARAERADPYTAAVEYAFLREDGKALDALERAYSAHSVAMPLVKRDPAFTRLAADPRFQQLVRKVGLP